MSHITRVQNVFVRKDLLLEALKTFGVQVFEHGMVRYWAGNSVRADIVARLHAYDLGFVLESAQARTAHDLSDQSEPVLSMPTQAYVPLYDSWNGEVEDMFGPNLCQLNARYYTRLLEQCEEACGPVQVEETQDSIILTVEV